MKKQFTVKEMQMFSKTLKKKLLMIKKCKLKRLPGCYQILPIRLANPKSLRIYPIGKSLGKDTHNQIMREYKMFQCLGGESDKIKKKICIS